MNSVFPISHFRHPLYADCQKRNHHCTVASFIVDVFFTQVAPSKMYDVLKDDFDYLFIGSVTGGMIVFSFLSRHFALKKVTSRAWK